MKIFTILRTLSVALLTPFIALNAQDAEDDDESIFDLSPFVIQEDEAVGYQALSTLAGTRIKTDLRDVGAAISVMTEEFMEDTGGTDGATLLAYGLNTEALGEHGNYSAGDGLDRRVLQKQPHISGQRVRGLIGFGGSATLTRDFFITDMPFDSYNTTAVTINRGPNALLFGTGKAGGILNNATIKASTAKTFGEIKIRIGENGAHRESLDFNKVLVQDRLAIRIALLNENQQFHQRPAFQSDQRFFATLTAVLAKNENSDFFGPTILRANFEEVELGGTPVVVRPPPDLMQDWWSVSRHAPYVAQIEEETGFDLPDYIDGASDKDGTFIPQFTYGGHDANPCCGGGGGVVNDIGGWGASLSFADINNPTPTVGLSGNPNQHGFFEYVVWNDWAPSNYIANYSESIYRQGGGGPWRKGYSRPPTLNNRQVLDNTKVQLGGHLNNSFSEFDAKNITVEQPLFGGKGGIEFAYDEQSYFNKSMFPYGDWFGLQIDLMEFLPSEQPNPNVGRAVMSAEIEKRENFWNREAQRVTAFYEFDLTEQDGVVAWLGKHILTGLWNEQQIDFLDLDRRNRWDTASSNNNYGRTVRDIFGGGLISRSGDRATILKYYLSDDLRGISRFEDVRLTQYTRALIPDDNTDWLIGWNDVGGGDPNTPGVAQGPTPNPAGVPNPDGWNPGDGGDPMYYNHFKTRDIVVQVGARNRQVIESTALAWQSKFWNDHIVGTFGWRNDKSVSQSQLSASDRDAEGFPTEKQFTLGPKDPAAEGDTTTAGVVVHLPEEWTRDQFGISFHYNESEAFEPVPSRRNIRGEILGAPNATTEEVGVTFEFLNRAVSLRIADYKMKVFTTSSLGSTQIESLTGVFGGLGNQAWAESLLRGDDFDKVYAQSERFGNVGNFSSHQDVLNALDSYLPQPTRGIVKSRFEPALPTPGATYTVDRIPNISTQSDVVSEGKEIELIGNLTRNWRVAVNYGEQETIVDNSVPAALEIALEAQQNLRSMNLYNLQADPNPGQDTETTIGDMFEGSVLNNLLNIKARDGTISEEQRRKRINAITSYDFTEGALAGFGVGGAYRWQDKAAVGYGKIRNPQTDTVIDDVTKPFFGPTETNIDLWFSYAGKLTDKIDWKIQLNVRNAFGDDDYIPTLIHPTGLVAVVRNPNPRDFFLTNTFSF